MDSSSIWLVARGDHPCLVHLSEGFLFSRARRRRLWTDWSLFSLVIEVQEAAYIMVWTQASIEQCIHASRAEIKSAISISIPYR